MIEISNDEGALLVDILNESMSWETYQKKCTTHCLAPSRLLVLGMLRVDDAKMTGGEHEGRGLIDEREIEGSTVSLTERGEVIARRTKQVRDIFCDSPVTSTPPRRRHHKRIRQGELFPPTN